MTKNTTFFLVLDQGTSSTKLFLIDSQGIIRFKDRIKHTVNRPDSHRWESDPLEILNAGFRLMTDAQAFAHRQGGRIVRAGMAVQRSTFLFWDKASLKPLTPAISWQDTRARDVVRDYTQFSDRIQSRTGTPLSPHFGAPKYVHLVRNNVELHSRARAGEIWYGPLSAFLTHSFTGQCLVDESIAGRTLLMDLETAGWDPGLCDLFGIPGSVLPQLVPTRGKFGDIQLKGDIIPLKCVIGDQQAALLGQAGSRKGALAMNFGTSGSVQLNAGSRPIHVPGLISSVLTSTESERLYLLEGTINTCNSLFYWLEEELNIPHSEMLWHKRCADTNTPGTFVPGFMALSAPYWVDKLTTVRFQLESATDNELIRAAMESIGHLVADIVQAMRPALGQPPELITASGGGARSPLLQFIADLLGIRVGHSAMKDRTALGVYELLLMDDKNSMGPSDTACDQIFEPEMDDKTRRKKRNDWRQTLKMAGVC